ncbi:chromosomal replication initiator protein DnaA [Mucisphaera calidilacus]|uniref:Chromosomal replication initiator protein DnaA n=1 Tax=Mucisphaera calidilacus TaxID=2527982 RepID=A0A518C0Z4_9BACT|nr:chromosomal replication initiator protein DnaA [Mucisphaera calidilacus]QDU72864.1 Chromosomal replication initiator protein DnaA [Mucisphaera calidilacus]
MPRLDDKLWRDMMAHLRRKHASICRQWFDELEPIALEGGLLRVRTTNSIQQNYLQKRCLEPFNDAAQAVTGALIAVRFEHHQTAAGPADHHKAESNGAATVETPAAAVAETKPAVPPQTLEIDVSDPMEPPAFSVTSDNQRIDNNGQAIELSDDFVLSPDYTFSNFITGPNNQLAYAASVAVANQPGTAYNPLFIHGGVGLGKTHLLQGICQAILTQRPETRIVYVSCEAFMTQFIESVQRGQMLQFRHRYRYADMLVIDDIHFLSSRERSQEEFFHTFNELYQANKQIVLSSDAAPSEIPHLEERLMSRFQWGLVANVTKPHFETRVAILRAKAKLRGVDVPDEVIAYMAQRIDSNARELEGAITNVLAHAALGGRPIDLELAAEALGDQINQPRSNHATLQQIIDVVTGYYSVKLSDLQSRRRHKSVTEPRQICMFLARRHTRYSLEEIGGHFGGRDHTTVMHSIKTIEERSQVNDGFAREITALEERLDQAPATPRP